MTQLHSPSVEDRFAIHELLAHYAWALDTCDADALVNCFTSDAVLIVALSDPPNRWVGHEGVRRMGEHYFSLPDFAGRQHHASQILITAADRGCKVKSYQFVTECRGEPPYPLRFAGYFEDWVVECEGEWRFKERILRLWGGETSQRLPAGHVRRGSSGPREKP